MASDVPKVDFPLPSGEKAATTDEISNVTVVEEHSGVETRRQVSADGKTVENVPVTRTAAAPPPLPAVPAAAPPVRRAVSHASGKFVVQVGAFAVEANAKSLQNRLTQLGQRSYVDRDSLYRVRIGPFITREEAIRARGSLEASGMSAIVVTE